MQSTQELQACATLVANTRLIVIPKHTPGQFPRTEDIRVTFQTTADRREIYLQIQHFHLQTEYDDWPDAGWFGLQVIPALVHVIQPVLQKRSLFWAAQSFDHLRLVPLHAFIDVIVGIDLGLDVLKKKTTGKKKFHIIFFFSHWGYWA